MDWLRLSAAVGSWVWVRVCAHTRAVQKLELYAHFYYYGGSEAPCYTWPAIGCDSYAHSPGIGYNGTNVGVLALWLIRCHTHPPPPRHERHASGAV